MYRQIKNKHEILSRSPKWMTKSGSTLLLGILVLLLIGSFYIKYPDIVEAKAIITTSKLPLSVRAQASGYLEDILVKSNDSVTNGQILAIIKSTANFKSVDKFKKNLSQLIEDISLSSSYQFPVIDSLGQLTKNYNEVKKAYYDLRKRYDNPIRELELKRINQEIIQSKEQLKKTESLKSKSEANFLIQKKQFTRDSILFSQNVISEQKFEDSRRLLINSMNDLAILKTEANLNHGMINALKIKFEEANLNGKIKEQDLTMTLIQTINSARAAINDWENSYLMKAPSNGTISFYKLLDKEQYIIEGDELMILLPKVNNIYAVCHTSLNNTGEISPGQETQIRISNFPYQKYGYVRGIVSSISDIPRNDKYMVKVDLKEGLKTNYNYSIPFKQEMIGDAIIITKDYRLIERFFHQFTLLSNR